MQGARPMCLVVSFAVACGLPLLLDRIFYEFFYEFLPHSLQELYVI